MRLLDLPAWLAAYGLDVETVAGWQSRGVAFPALPKVVVGHHTATGNRARGDLPTLAILRDGRSDLPGPLCQIGLGRSGLAYVIASGKANHAGKGCWGDVTGGAMTVGIEVEHPGTGPWTAVQLDAFDRVAAALLEGLGATAEAYCGHREWALPRGRKVDPGGVDLDAQRRRIHALLARSTKTPAPEDDDMPLSDADVARIAHAITGGARKRDADGTIIDANGAPISTADIFGRLERVEAKLDQLIARQP